MRALFLILALSCAAGAAQAQDYRALTQANDAERVATEAAARQRDIALTNELSTLQARAQSEQHLSDLAALRARPALPSVVLGPNAPPPRIDTSKLVSIPDATLADSNAKVRAAADNRR